MSTNYVATPFSGLAVDQVPGENWGTWTPFANPTFVINDVLFLCQIPNGAALRSFFIDLPQLDTGTSLVINVGDNLTTTAGGVGISGYFSGSTVGRSATSGQNNIFPGNVSGFVHGSLPKVYSIAYQNIPVAGQAFGSTATGAPAGIWLCMQIGTAAQTATTTGSIYGYIQYSYFTSTAGQTNPLL